MSKKKKQYEVRRWVSFPAFYTVTAESAVEAREQACKMAQAYVDRLKLQGVHIDEGDAVVATPRSEEDPFGKVLLYRHENEERK